MTRLPEPTLCEKNFTIHAMHHRPRDNTILQPLLERGESNSINLPTIFLHRCAGNQNIGLTLVEMLTVMGIIAVLSALVLPAVTSLNKSNALNNSGRLFMNLLSNARSEAIARRTVVRVEVATTWPDPAFSYRKVTLTAAALNAEGTTYIYQQLGKWETLEEGVVFEVHDPLPGAASDSSIYLFAANAATPLGDEGSLTYAGQAVATVYVAFSSTGSLVEQRPPSSLPIPIRARLVEGILGTAGTVTYTRRTTASMGDYPTANWFDIRINNLVGRIEAGRPEAPLPNLTPAP